MEAFIELHHNLFVLSFLCFFFVVVVVQNDSILAFHSHGMQGRALRNGAITQEITDTSKTYRLLGSEK